MTAVNFPDEPVDGQIFEIPGRAWQWSETDGVWKALFGTLATLVGHSETHESGGTDEVELTPEQITGTAVIDSDTRLSDARTPIAHASSHGSAGSDSIAIEPNQVTGTAVVDSDSRLSDSRTPTAHATSHQSGGSDAITVAQSQVTDLTTDLAGKSPLAGSTSITTVGTVTTATSPTAAGSTGLRKITISTATPSGGADGDVWLRYV
jgi:hypothetical protein